ncbi:hypothetical protein RND71_019217 [Anisodus tanguticus]|uniref:Uncharacterized protein n=1 Tax=Anisodus tanguticus TaxID=243964 RepID=A0AAE1VH77_9SOLA|nr:hypothetical protein RND71_019217 [Anisodus tanguticus]
MESSTDCELDTDNNRAESIPNQTLSKGGKSDIIGRISSESPHSLRSGPKSIYVICVMPTKKTFIFPLFNKMSNYDRPSHLLGYNE